MLLVLIPYLIQGYSSLSRLKHLNVDKIKIDRSFLNDADTDPKSVGIYQNIVALAQRLDIDVVAEGVETLE
ncbi:EAL domain-containing protein [Shewanella aestuarii]|uniref:EAL domain-containing protein n=1 Tax=Shewanella aestuarii TaxID=1028752 RepID=A0A6G9QMD1_9GAMM|nr:EAL domain-containing protein [Shewanella aestuarii]QIR15744.1 EAL domain-containing protein [Shewanella aestuarii]